MLKCTTLLCLICLLYGGQVSACPRSVKYQALDQLALESGADKASNYHNYTEIYAKYFASLKNKPIKFLEIGIYKGASVKLWEAYFSKADLHFIDISLDNAQYFSERSHYYIADQSNPVDLEKFVQASGGEFDVILDDGGHKMHEQITSFVSLFPHVKSGGMYIIEDLHTSYWPGHFGGGDHPHTAIAFLKGLIDDVNVVGARTGKASHLNIDPSVAATLSNYQLEIESIHFYDSVAIILKR